MISEVYKNTYTVISNEFHYISCLPSDNETFDHCVAWRIKKKKNNSRESDCVLRTEWQEPASVLLKVVAKIHVFREKNFFQKASVAVEKWRFFAGGKKTDARSLPFTRGARLPVVGPAGAMTRNYNNSPATRVRGPEESTKCREHEEAREICQRQTQSSGNRFIRPPPPKTLLAISPRTKRPDDLF